MKKLDDFLFNIPALPELKPDNELETIKDLFLDWFGNWSVMIWLIACTSFATGFFTARFVDIVSNQSV